MPIARLQPSRCIFCTFRFARDKARFDRLFSICATRSRQDVRVRKVIGYGAERVDVSASRIRQLRSKPQFKDEDAIKHVFKKMVIERLDELEPKFRESPVFQQPGFTEDQIDLALSQFRWHVRESVNKVKSGNELRQRLMKAYMAGGDDALDSELNYVLYNHFLGRHFTHVDMTNQRALADLRWPTEWFPTARVLHRTIHAHVGPTNSGKTYHALKRLETAAKGVYAGPLRLLAHEVYTRMNAKGKACALITGEEQRLPENWQTSDTKLVSATVEMTSLNEMYDVAVIDEIQMLGSLDRGSAWTQALLGLRCPEIHVCGETRALPIIRELAAACGDKLVVHEYDRLTRLRMDKEHIGSKLNNLRKGDCVVTFSVVNIHALRTEIEKKTGKKAAVVYGSLPPETRAQQARLFNDPDNDYDFLVASDAVGMGLNLSIKRIIFEAVHKYDASRIRALTVSEIRQIAGRAGRYRSSHQDIAASRAATTTVDVGSASEAVASSPHATNDSRVSGASPAPEGQCLEVLEESLPRDHASIDSATDVVDASGELYPATPVDLSTRAAPDLNTIGLVTTIEPQDFALVSAALETEPPPLTFASIQPNSGLIHKFASYFPPGTPLSYILLRLTELSETKSRYRIDHKKELILMADLIHDVPGMSIEERMSFITAPTSIRDRTSKLARLTHELAECIGNQKGGTLLDLKHLPLDVLDTPSVGTKQRLRDLEELHKGVVLYLWLSFRFPGVFTQRPLANYTKEMVEKQIELTLQLMTFIPSAQRRSEMRRRNLKEAEVRDAIAREGGLGPQFGDSGEVATLADPVIGDDTSPVAETMPVDDEGEYPEGDVEAETFSPEASVEQASRARARQMSRSEEANEYDAFREYREEDIPATRSS